MSQSDDCNATEDLYLVREVADQLFEANQYEDALKFYVPVEDQPKQVDGAMLVRMGRCFVGKGDDTGAEIYFKKAVAFDAQNIEARMELARMYEKLNKPEQALHYVNEAMQLRKKQNPKIPRRISKRADGMHPGKRLSAKERKSRAARANPHSNQHLDENSKTEHLQSQYHVYRNFLDGMRAGDPVAASEWMDAARDLTDDFRGFKTFYPWDKYIKFLGYSGESRSQAETSLDLDLTVMAERLSRGLFSRVHVTNMN